MKTSVENKIVLGFVSSVLALTGIGWFAYSTTARLVATEDIFTHTYKVIATLESGRAILTDAETAQRGYLLTGDDNFLKDCTNAQAQVNGWVEKLRKYISDNPAQLARLDKLQPLISRRLAILNSRIKLRQQQGFQAAVSAVSTREGKDLMDQIQQAISEMHGEEDTLAFERQQEVQTSAVITEIVIVGASALACAAGLVAILFIRRDLRLRQRAQEELNRFFSLSLDFLCIASSDGYFKRVSPAVTEILGWSIQEFLARPFIEFVHPDDRAATLREVEKQIVSGEKVLRFENRYQHKDGSWRVLSWRSLPQPGGLMYATARDVTEQMRAEAEIIRQKMELEAANKELEAFSYSVSHDLRGPLRAVDGFSQAVQEDYGGLLPEEGRRYLQIIREGAQRMGVLIDDLLAFSRLSRAPVNEQPVNTEKLVREVIEELDPRQSGRQIEIHIGELPPCQGDAALLKQVWVNLLSNAFKYTRNRNPAVVEIGCTRENDRNVYFVRDNGAGFDMKYAHKLFGVFQRLHRADEYEGTGVGLAIVQRVVHRHGGQIRAEAALDRGATFYFSLKGETKS